MTRSKHSQRVNQRLEYAKEIEAKIRTWCMGEFFRLSTVHLALFLMAPMSVFQPGRILSPADQTEEFLHLGLTAFPPLIRHFLEQSLVSQRYNGGFNQPESDLCLQRDGNACILTGEPEPKICYILPLSWGDSQAAMKKTLLLRPAINALMGPGWMQQHQQHIGNSDRVWNMLCLSEKLQDLWKRGSCAFKGIRIQPVSRHESVVVLEFHWMPEQDKVKPLVHAKLEGRQSDWTKMANTIHKLSTSELPATDAQSELSIPSGKRIEVRMRRRDAANFKAMIDLQWACIAAAALSGATSPGMLHEYEPYWWRCDEGVKFNVLSWLDNIV
ncbi:hypothetical protein N0V84_007223 [Fusarium piperis]|uniref:HNH nuclease domain-containing protein n=1 Tax=Fusarium piperis TaxID=1435070 RepID=A0A9W9BNW2_9HYPO|nr:hypothetical protein N0V84_007223 [Fusarium piperis]